jgi:N-acyl-D-amino-acid deacylase
VISKLLLLVPVALAAADYDVLIRNARVVDGAGNAWFRADVGVKGDRIAAVGSLGNATAEKVIDARDRVLAPGFIDVHTHIEGGVERRPRGDNFLLDGVTTVVTGNCGSSTLKVAEWFSALEKSGLGLNVATLIGHNSVRREVMGSAQRAPTPDEIGRMQSLVERAMREGAVGFSTGLEYVPGTYSNTAEIVAVAKAAGKYGGVYASHMRDEGEKITEAITEAVTVGKETGLRVEISHFKIDTPRLWGASAQSLALVERFRREGVDVVVDQYPYDRFSTGLAIRLPSWAHAEGKLKERLADPATRAKISAETQQMLRNQGLNDFSYATVARFTPNPAYEGKTITEINVSKGRPKTLAAEVETVFDLLIQGSPSMVYHGMSDVDVERIIRYPFTAIASDGGIVEPGQGTPHPRAYGTNARVLSEFVRKRGTLTLEDAIRRMTSLPARTFGFRDRGLVREGMAADLVLLDPQRVEDKATFTQPHQYSAGFDMVMVNGKIAAEQGKLTAVRSGRPLRAR